MSTDAKPNLGRWEWRLEHLDVEDRNALIFIAEAMSSFLDGAALLDKDLDQLRGIESMFGANRLFAEERQAVEDILKGFDSLWALVRAAEEVSKLPAPEPAAPSSSRRSRPDPSSYGRWADKQPFFDLGAETLAVLWMLRDVVRKADAMPFCDGVSELLTVSYILKRFPQFKPEFDAIEAVNDARNMLLCIPNVADNI